MFHLGNMKKRKKYAENMKKGGGILNFSKSQSLRKYEEVWRTTKEIWQKYVEIEEKGAWNFIKSHQYGGGGWEISKFFLVGSYEKYEMKKYEEKWKNMKEKWRNVKKIWRKYEEIWIFCIAFFTLWHIEFCVLYEKFY